MKTAKSTASEEPKDWRKLYDRLRDFRRTLQAPVDTIGCDKLHCPLVVSARVKRFQILVSLLLSSQTKDQVTAQAMHQLHQLAISKGFKEGLCVEMALESSGADLDQCISKVGFHNKKSQFIKQVADRLHADYRGDIPATAEAMMRLPGIGPKMAYLAVQTAWERCEGIGVDTHVHRIASRFKWVPQKCLAKGPEATREALEAWLPKDLWPDINPMLVGLGQTICTPLRPKCDQCQLSDLCPSADRRLTGAKAKGNVETVDINNINDGQVDIHSTATSRQRKKRRASDGES